MTFELRGYMEILEGLCAKIQSVGTIKCLKICLTFDDNRNYDKHYDKFPVEKVRELSERYPGIRNLNIRLSNRFYGLEWIKVYGEKEQIFSNYIL